MRKINQNYIAEHLNLSVTTISRCFTNHPKINPDTRARVLQFALEHGYRYNGNRNQKQTRKGETGKIAVLIGVAQSRVDASEVASRVLQGITQKAAALHFRVNPFFVDPRSFSPNMRSRRIIPDSFHNDWAGIILVFPFQTEAVQALSTRYHVISLLDEYDDLTIDSINPDEGRGISMMVRHLHARGHRRLGYLSWIYNNVETPWVEKRLGAYVEYLYRLGLPFRPEDVIRLTEQEARDPTAGADRVIARMEAGMTALVCAADHQAYELIQRLRERGIRVPGDLSITGYDGIPAPPGLPQLTTYSTPFQEVGNTGIVSLQRRLDHPLASRSHILIDGNKIPGSTTGSPAREIASFA